MARSGLDVLGALRRGADTLMFAQTDEAGGGLDHATRRFGLRFANDRTEQQYREWRIGTATPFARVGYIGSIPSWCLLLVAVAAFDSESLSRAAPLIAGWIVALVALTAATYPKALQRTVMPLAALANCVAGFLIVYLLFDAVLREQSTEWLAGVMTAGMLIVMFFGFAIYRVPPALAMAAVTPYVAFASYRLYDAYDNGELSGTEAAALGSGQWIAYLGCLLVCVVIEAVTRRSFCKDQIIGAQQRELQRRGAEAARREVERNIHDGTQQKLLAMLVDLRVAEIRFGDEAGPQLRESLTQMADRLNSAIEELRELARGVHPAIVVEHGLAAGLVSLAERAPLPIVLDAVPEQRLPAELEVTAYYVVSEAIANAAKHGNASEVRIRAQLTGDTFEMQVSDDGTGGAELNGGTGLRGLGERVEAIGGRLEVDSPSGGGTTLRATIPAGPRVYAEAPSGSDIDRR